MLTSAIDVVVVKETPGGYWYIKNNFATGTKRCWVSKSRKGNKYPRYCYANKADAWYSYQVRVNKRIHHLERDLSVAKAAKEIIALGRKRAEKGERGVSHNHTDIKLLPFDISGLDKLTIKG